MWESDVLIGDEEKKGKRRKDKKKRHRDRASNPATLAHLVSYYYLHGSYDEIILLTPANRGI